MAHLQPPLHCNAKLCFANYSPFMNRRYLDNTNNSNELPLLGIVNAFFLVKWDPMGRGGVEYERKYRETICCFMTIPAEEMENYVNKLSIVCPNPLPL